MANLQPSGLKGESSNSYRGKQFQSYVRDYIYQEYNDQIDLIKENYKIPDIEIEVDFLVNLKNQKKIFVEAKYRNGDKKGLAKHEAAAAVITQSHLIKLHCMIGDIKDYEFIVVSNALPSDTSAVAKWLAIHEHAFKTIHKFVTLPEYEKDIESLDNLENLFNG